MLYLYYQRKGRYKQMTISEMKKILEALENQGLGDLEVINGTNDVEIGATIEEINIAGNNKVCIWWN